MIPLVVKREQLMTANGLFILGAPGLVRGRLRGARPAGPTVFGTELLIIIVAAAYGIAGLFCWILPSAPPSSRGPGLGRLGQARRRRHVRAAARGPHLHPRPPQHLLVADLPGHDRVAHRRPRRARAGLREERAGPRRRATSSSSCCRWARASSAGIIVLNLVGRFLSRRRLIEGGMIALAAVAHHPRPGPGPARAPQRTRQHGRCSRSSSSSPSWPASATRSWRCPPRPPSRRSCPADVRGRVFGVLNMLVSLASFLPIIIVGPVADVIGTSAVIVTFALIVGRRGRPLDPLRPPARDGLGRAREHRAGRPDDDHDGLVDAQPAHPPALHRREDARRTRSRWSRARSCRAGPAPHRSRRPTAGPADRRRPAWLTARASSSS